MCNRIDSNSTVNANPSSAGPKPSGDLGTARKRCFEVPQAPNGASSTDAQARQVQSQLTGILTRLM